MYPGKSASKFGAKRAAIIGGGHQIATFPDHVSGAAAQFDLLQRAYCGITVEQAITKWSGGNSVDAYLKAIKRRTGLAADDVLTREYIEDPTTGIAFARAMARHEAGKEYPLTVGEWAEAHAKAIPQESQYSGATIELARDLIGMREVKGKEDNPEIMRCYVDAGHPEIKHDETPWCAAFVCSVLQRTGMHNPKTLSARDFLNYGEKLEEPEEGCIAVFSRGDPSSWQGHVGFVDNFDETHFYLLGGNQSDAVNIARVPRNSSLLGLRRPIPALKPALETISDSRTLKSTLNGLVSLALGLVYGVSDWVATGWQSLLGMAGFVPDAVSKAEEAISTGQRSAQLFNLDWPVAFSASIAVVCFTYALMRGFGERRTRKR